MGEDEDAAPVRGDLEAGRFTKPRQDKDHAQRLRRASDEAGKVVDVRGRARAGRGGHSSHDGVIGEDPGKRGSGAAHTNGPEELPEGAQASSPAGSHSATGDQGKQAGVGPTRQPPTPQNLLYPRKADALEGFVLVGEEDGRSGVKPLPGPGQEKTVHRSGQVSKNGRPQGARTIRGRGGPLRTR